MILLPTKTELPWESPDAVALSEFLRSQTGTRLLHHLSLEMPSLLDGSDVNKTLVASGEVKGFQKALDTLLTLTVERPPETPVQSEMYPSLDDEEKWKDLDQPTN